MAINPYANTADQDLVYYGDDTIVWDRINAERLRRGLPGLAEIGIPRPQDDTAAPGTVSAAGAPIEGIPSSLTNFAVGTTGQRQALGALETRRSQLTKAVTLTQTAQFSNQRTLARVQQQLADTTDPEQRQALLDQSRTLQSVIDSESQVLAQATQQLDTVNTDITAGLAAAFPDSPALAGLPIPTPPALPQLPDLGTVPVSLPVNAADVLKATPATVKIPGLDASQVTGLLGSAAKTASATGGNLSAALGTAAGAAGVAGAVGAATTALPSTGVGKFAATPEQLEKQGLLKPGTSKSFLSSPVTPTAADIAEAERINSEGGDITPEQVASNRRTNEVLSSPFSWTGKNGVSNLEGFTNNDALQNLTQQNLMSDGVDKLRSLGVATGNETPAQAAALAQAAAKFGPDAVAAWSKGEASPEITASINNIAKDAQQAVDLVDRQLPTLGAIPKSVEGAVSTVDRTKLDQSFAAVLGDPKISLPSFGGAAALGGSFDSALSANTKDEDLVYTGDDSIVWDRINAERIRRGLPGLAAIGYPRPPDSADAVNNVG